MAQYTLAVPQCFIRQIRSLRNDTLVASMGLRVLNAQGALHHDWPALSVNLGDHQKGTSVAIGLSYQDVDVPDPTSQLPDGGSIYWSFLLANMGHSDSGTVAVLSKAADAIAGALAGKLFDAGGLTPATLGAFAAVLGIQELLNLLTANCDGVVGVLGLALTAADLAQMSPDLNQVNCPGTNSPAGCGANSNYDISYRIVANSALVTVPDLLGASPEVAQGLAQQAGLFFSSFASRTGSPHEIPHVDSQNPDPGSKVPPASSVQAIIIFPAPRGHPTP
jgi:hypothetical protein